MSESGGQRRVDAPLAVARAPWLPAALARRSGSAGARVRTAREVFLGRMDGVAAVAAADLLRVAHLESCLLGRYGSRWTALRILPRCRLPHLNRPLWAGKNARVALVAAVAVSAVLALVVAAAGVVPVWAVLCRSQRSKPPRYRSC